MAASKVWRVQARVNGLARRRSQRQEDHRVEYVRHLAHQKEPGKSVLAGGLPEISLPIGLLVVRKAHLARQDPTMEASKVWRVQPRVNGLARRRSQRQEDHRVEYVRHLAHIFYAMVF